jgi:hypothetical protein
MGRNRFLQTEVTHHDFALVKTFDWEEIPAQDTCKRFLPNLTKQQTKKSAIISIHGYLTTSS